MRGIETIRKANPTLAETIERRGGFIIAAEVPLLENIDRLMLVLVRCGNGRFLCPVQDVRHFMAIIEEHYRFKSGGKDVIPMEDWAKIEGEQPEWVRDVSLPD